MKVLVYDFRWKDASLCELQGSVDGKFGRKPVTVGETISLKICGAPHCAGFIEHNIWKPCPKHSVGKAKCEYCRSIEGNFVYTAFDGFNQDQLQPGDLEKISGKHVVYFALFDADVIKIGVSNLERKTLRQVEQGSHQTLYIAETTDGISARQIETLFRQSGLSDKVMGRQKRSLMLPAISEKEGEKVLRSLFQEHVLALDSTPHLKEFLLPTPEFHDWSHVYHTNQVLGKPLHAITLQEGEAVSGTIIAIKGPFVMIDTSEELVSVDFKTLAGKDCDLSPKPTGLTLNTALQNSLF